MARTDSGVCPSKPVIVYGDSALAPCLRCDAPGFALHGPRIQQPLAKGRVNDSDGKSGVIVPGLDVDHAALAANESEKDFVVPCHRTLRPHIPSARQLM